MKYNLRSRVFWRKKEFNRILLNVFSLLIQFYIIIGSCFVNAFLCAVSICFYCGIAYHLYDSIFKSMIMIAIYDEDVINNNDIDCKRFLEDIAIAS
ncbi:hypothetical protein COBT_001973 [Conglomerata obtusa]